jgi:hypothetical protein
MDLEVLTARARFAPADYVHYQATVYRITARYYRPSADLIVYDLLEIVRPGHRPRVQHRVPDQRLHRPSLHSLGLMPDPTEQHHTKARSKRW